MHLTLQALGVDAEVVGRALAIVVGGEASELLHRSPHRRIIVAFGGADDANGLVFLASVWLSLHQLVSATCRKKVRNLNHS